ncbi:hypothetical protein FGO68_gene5317 [Halteria grandinella]|uniref:Uncharacterized protein n=1 Tax=Halteria grandinella TaxID=5974 RepID=A0A8J8NV53_HALGN|nr:hypothetical protein FGO68_gene5317 [Halteria grandinella]
MNSLQPRLKVGKIFQKYVLLEILQVGVSKSHCYHLLFYTSRSSRKYLIRYFKEFLQRRQIDVKHIPVVLKEGTLEFGLYLLKPQKPAYQEVIINWENSEQKLADFVAKIKKSRVFKEKIIVIKEFQYTVSCNFLDNFMTQNIESINDLGVHKLTFKSNEHLKLQNQNSPLFNSQLMQEFLYSKIDFAKLNRVRQLEIRDDKEVIQLLNSGKRCLSKAPMLNTVSISVQDKHLHHLYEFLELSHNNLKLVNIDINFQDFEQIFQNFLLKHPHCMLNLKSIKITSEKQIEGLAKALPYLKEGRFRINRVDLGLQNPNQLYTHEEPILLTILRENKGLQYLNLENNSHYDEQQELIWVDQLTPATPQELINVKQVSVSLAAHFNLLRFRNIRAEEISLFLPEGHVYIAMILHFSVTLYSSRFIDFSHLITLNIYGQVNLLSDFFIVQFGMKQGQYVLCSLRDLHIENIIDTYNDQNYESFIKEINPQTLNKLQLQIELQYSGAPALFRIVQRFPNLNELILKILDVNFFHDSHLVKYFLDPYPPELSQISRLKVTYMPLYSKWRLLRPLNFLVIRIAQIDKSNKLKNAVFKLPGIEISSYLKPQMWIEAYKGKYSDEQLDGARIQRCWKYNGQYHADFKIIVKRNIF